MMPAAPHIIGIAGPSCSGKSEIARRLIQQFSGMNPVTLTLDSYYHDLSSLDPEERDKKILMCLMPWTMIYSGSSF